MLGEVGLEREPLATVGAGKRLEAGVRLAVGAQVALVGKALAAHLAPERLLACVGAQVSLQQPRPREGLAAEAAAAGCATAVGVVGAPVHVERRDGGVRLVAVGAGMGACLGAAGALVALEARGVGVAFAAYSATNNVSGGGGNSGNWPC